MNKVSSVAVVRDLAQGLSYIDMTWPGDDPQTQADSPVVNESVPPPDQLPCNASLRPASRTVAMSTTSSKYTKYLGRHFGI